METFSHKVCRIEDFPGEKLKLRNIQVEQLLTYLLGVRGLMGLLRKECSVQR